MANVLDGLVPDLYKAAEIVGREAIGFVTSVTLNTGVEGVAVGQPIRSSFTEEPTVGNTAPSMTIPEGDDQEVTYKDLVLTKSRGVSIPWTGEDYLKVDGQGGGAGYRTIYGNQIARAMKKLVNEIEADIFMEAYKNASRAVGTAGTTPFAANFDLVADVRKILVDNGCPMDDGRLSLVMNTAAGTNLRKVDHNIKVNEAGSPDLVRRGYLLETYGLMLKESAQISLHTKGTGAGYLINDATPTAGKTTIAADTGTGTILAGDAITFAGTSDVYMVNSALSGGSFTIGNPGLLTAETDGDAITIGNSYTPNVAFHQSAIEFAMRPPAEPMIGGVRMDAALDNMVVQDPVTGLTFDIAVYGGFKKAMIYISAVWGVKTWMPEFVSVLRG